LKDSHRRGLDTAAELGLQSVTTHYLWPTGLDDPNFIRPEIFVAYARNVIREGPAFFREVVRVLGGPEAFLPKNNEMYRWFCDEAAQRGVTVTIETAMCHLTRTPAQIIGIIGEIGRPNLGICLDSGHSHIAGVDVAAAVREAGPHLVETHFHDNFGDLDLHRPVGLGTIHWPEVILALREIGFPGPVTFEAGGVSAHSREEELRMYAGNWRELLHTTAHREARLDPHAG